MSKLTFLVSDESINTYGFRVLTSGIDIKHFKKNPLMLYMHTRDSRWGEKDCKVIGRWENIRKEDGKLYADAVFDEKDEFALKIKQKVEDGFLKMASIGFDAIAWSDEEKHVIKGQTRATVTKSLLEEISIVDSGANRNAFKLYKNGQETELADAIPELKLKKNVMFEKQKVVLALSLNVDATEDDVVAKINQLSADSVELKKVKKEQGDNLKAEAEATVDMAIEKGHCHLSFRELAISTYLANPISEKAKYDKLLTSQNKELSKVIDGLGTSHNNEEISFEKLSKENPKELQRIEEEDPELYKKIHSTYINS